MWHEEGQLLWCTRALGFVILQVVRCGTLMILQMLLLLASSSNGGWGAGAGEGVAGRDGGRRLLLRVCLRSVAKINPFPSFSAIQLQPDVQGKGAKEIN